MNATGDNGKQAELTYRYTVEAVKPRVTIKSPQDNATYNKNEQPKADYWCQNDDGSALAATGCRGSEVDGEPLDMTPGDHSFTVKATDNYGRQAELAHHYTVKDSPVADDNSNGDDGTDPGVGDDNNPGRDSDPGGGGDSINVGGVIGSIGNTTYNIVGLIGDNVVIGSIGNAASDVAGSVGDTAEGLRRGKLPDTGGGWTVLLFAGTALVGGGWFLLRLARRFSR